jgi:sigma-B regulation protein RsbU (phosphoserine phosphatase)
VVGFLYGPGQGLPGRALQSRTEQFDPAATSGLLEGQHAALIVPLVRDERLVALLWLASYNAAEFGTVQRRYLRLLGAQLAAAIENADLYAQVREQARGLSLLHEISREIGGLLDRDSLIARTAKVVRRIVDASHVHFHAWDPEHEVLHHHGVGHTLQLGQGLVGTAASLRHPVRVGEVRRDPRFIDCGAAAGIRSELAVPLVVRDRLLGVLDLTSSEANAFGAHHEQMLGILAGALAVALENADLYEQLRRDEQRLEEDLNAARTIQQGLLRTSIPIVRGLEVGFRYEPARELAGDFYDFLPCDGGRLMVAVGDVAGKSAAAALYGALALGLLRGYVGQSSCEPADILEGLNPTLRERRLDRRFVALALAAVDPHTGTATVATAGFPPPWHLTPNAPPRELPLSGLPLGALDAAHYQQLEIALAPGDLLVFASDGISEHPAVDMELGEHLKSLAHLSSQAIADALIALTPDGPDCGDDRTVVVLRLLES